MSCDCRNWRRAPATAPGRSAICTVWRTGGTCVLSLWLQRHPSPGACACSAGTGIRWRCQWLSSSFGAFHSPYMATHPSSNRMSMEGRKTTVRCLRPAPGTYQKYMYFNGSPGDSRHAMACSASAEATSPYTFCWLVAELWLRLRLAAAPLLCWLNACCGLWMMACAVPALLTDTRPVGVWVAAPLVSPWSERMNAMWRSSL